MSIFKTAKIAGKAGEEITPDLLGKVGRSVAGLLEGSGTVLVGCDGREPSPALAKALAEGAAAGGCVVADVGAVPRALADFGARLLRARAALYAAGSEEGDSCEVALFFDQLPADRSRVKALQTAVESGAPPERGGGEIESWDEDIAEEYFQWLAATAPPPVSRRKAKALVMAPKGVLEQAAQRMGEALPSLEVQTAVLETPVYLPASGGSVPKMSALGTETREAGADFGALVDASGLWARFADDKGRALSPDETGLLLIRHSLGNLKAQTVVLDARMNQPLADEVKQSGGNPVFAPVGEAGLMAAMKSTGGALALGAEGVAVFRIAHDPDALHAVVRMAMAIAAQEASLSTLRKGIKLPPVLGDAVVPCRPEWCHPILSRIRSAHPRHRQTEVEGVRVRLDDGWALAAPLQDQEAMLYRFGGQDQETVERIAAEFFDSAVEIRDAARRLAGLPPRPAREDDEYDDYGI